jgi:hypothetical protein
LDKLTSIFNPKKQVNATIEIVDIAGIQKGDSTSSQFTSNLLSKIKTNDALLHVVRGFEDENIPHTEGSIDIIRDIKLLEDELTFSDMAFLESRFEKLEKEMMKQKNKDALKKEYDYMKRWNNALQNNVALRELDMDSEEEKFIKNYQPLTAKPLLIALNLSENQISDSNALITKVKSNFSGNKIAVEPFFAKIEMELAELPEDEKQDFMKEYGLIESPINRLIRAAYQLLGLQSFFTVGEDECRAWTIKKGMNAQEAAAVIHTDFFNKFIRAEVVHYNHFIEAGSIAKCREKGTLRLEGKDYIVQDGDIINIRHG